MLNWSLLKNPLNWLTVILMLLIAGYGGHTLLAYLGVTPASPSNNNN